MTPTYSQKSKVGVKFEKLSDLRKELERMMEEES